MSFNLKVEENSNQSGSQQTTYQTPGIFENIKITEIKFGKSSVKQTPFIQMVTVGQNGEIGQSNRMYLSTLKGEGKQTAAWNITAKNIVDLICATHKMARQDAENIELVPANEENIDKQYDMLVNKVSSLLVGRPFRGKFKGDQTKENGLIYATLDRVESMDIPRVSTGLRFSEDKDIKLFNVPTEVSSSPF